MEKVSIFLKKGKESFFLLGPRGTGKSTTIKDLYPDAIYIDLLMPDIYRNCLARPERLREVVHANPEKNVVVLDEIQKVPELLDVVHGLMEEKRGRQFILTGSSARKIKKKKGKLLSARARVCEVQERKKDG